MLCTGRHVRRDDPDKVQANNLTIHSSKTLFRCSRDNSALSSRWNQVKASLPGNFRGCIYLACICQCAARYRNQKHRRQSYKLWKNKITSRGFVTNTCLAIAPEDSLDLRGRLSVRGLLPRVHCPPLVNQHDLSERAYR